MLHLSLFFKVDDPIPTHFFPQKVMVSVPPPSLWLSVKVTKEPLSNPDLNVSLMAMPISHLSEPTLSPCVAEALHYNNKSPSISLQGPWLGFHSSQQAFPQPGDLDRASH